MTINIELALSILSLLTAITALISFVYKANKAKKAAEKEVAETASSEAAEKTRSELSLDYIKLQNETIIAGNRSIADKLDDQNIRLTRLETTVSNSHLSEIPERLSAVEESVKSAHKRITKIEEMK